MFRSFVYFFVRFVRSFARSLFCSFVCSFIRSFVCSYVWFARSFARSFVRSLGRSDVFFVRSFVRSFQSLHSSSYQLYLLTYLQHSDLLFCIHHTAHSPDNSFLGFVVSGPVPEDVKPPKKKPIGLVYGKDVEFWAVKILDNIVLS